MPFQKVEFQKLSPAYRNAFTKAKDVIAKGNLDYGITLLKEIVIALPGFVEARKILRDAEEKKAAQMGGIAKLIAGFRQTGDIAKATAKRKQPEQAIRHAEEAGAKLLNRKVLVLIAEIALDLEEYELSVDCYDRILDANGDDEAALNDLIVPLDKLKDYKRILQIRQYFASKYPKNLDLQQALREAAAMASMGTAKFIDDGSSRSNVPGSTAPNTEDLEKGDRILRSEEDIKELISRYEKNISAGQQSLDNYRKVAGLYYRVGRFQDAIDAYNHLVEIQGTLDPVIDREIEKSFIALTAKKVERLKKENAPREEILRTEKAIVDYRLERAKDRVSNYPNDLQMRYDLALVYWELGDMDHALEEFQHARRNPQRKLSAMVYLGKCLHTKGQYDMALDQFEEALKEMYIMDKTKMNALYCKGLTLDAMGKKDEAFECFKQIYSHDVGFQNVAEKVNAYYESRKSAGEA